jgi:hypothetical protein
MSKLRMQCIAWWAALKIRPAWGCGLEQRVLLIMHTRLVGCKLQPEDLSALWLVVWSIFARVMHI